MIKMLLEFLHLWTGFHSSAFKKNFMSNPWLDDNIGTFRSFLDRMGWLCPPPLLSTLNKEGCRRMAGVCLGPHCSENSSFPGSLFAKMVWTSGVGAFFFPSWVSIYSRFCLLWFEIIDDYHGKGDCFFSESNAHREHHTICKYFDLLK